MKKQHETHIQYKHRVIDTVSGSFCAAKWLNATVWLGDGRTASCHHPVAHQVNLATIADDPSALHNTDQKKYARKQMLEGIRPSECEYCWKIEDMGRDSVSDRVFKTIIYDDDTISDISKTPWSQNINPKTLEIAFDRTCNFACSYCNASFSTTWGNDIKKNGPYRGLVSDGAGAFIGDGSNSQPYRDSEDNPYIQAFWKWWPELSKDLEELRITGGEPLMSPDVWRLLDYFIENGMGDTRLAINSNLGAKDSFMDRFVEKAQALGSIDLYTSCEAMGEHAEYIRDGLNWDKFIHNCERMMREGNLRTFNMMMTVNSLCLFSITDFWDLMLDWKEQYGDKAPVWSVNILRFPSFQSALVLPTEIKDRAREHIREWFDGSRQHHMKEMERDGIRRLIDYLEVVDDPHGNVSPIETRQQDFKSFFKQYDSRRGKDLRAVFTELAEWVNK